MIIDSLPERNIIIIVVLYSTSKIAAYTGSDGVGISSGGFFCQGLDEPFRYG